MCLTVTKKLIRRLKKMNLKEQMMNQYQKKDSEKIKDAIAEAMKIGRNEVLYGKDVITDDIRKEFQDGGFTVEDYEDKHTIDAKIELVRFSW
ncbi:predicted protein [Enterococcus faecium 1,231,408]|nr:predicted protein [Enterococcus faecium 1,231,410]EEV56866.1 predicted protein [Enterococcus faecium 1,231,408]